MTSDPALAVGELGGVVLPQDTGTWKLSIARDMVGEVSRSQRDGNIPRKPWGRDSKVRCLHCSAGYLYLLL